MSDKKELQKNPVEALQHSEKSLNGLIDFYKPQLMKRASEELRQASPEKQDQFLSRTIMSILKNEKLRECFNTIQGKASIVMLVDNCLMTGLELEKHAYGVPYKKKLTNGTWICEANFQIKRQGYHSLLCGGLKPIFKDLRWSVVYEKEKDNIKISKSNGEVDHPACIDADKGNPIGCWVQAVNLDDSKIADYFSIKQIYDIRDNHSKTYQDYLEKLNKWENKKLDYKPNAPAWKTDIIPMIEKTAIKAFCRPYADVKEALQNAYYSEKEEQEEYSDRSNIVDIAETVLDNQMENVGESAEIIRDDIQEEKEPEFHDENMAKETKTNDGSLFGKKE